MSCFINQTVESITSRKCSLELQNVTVYFVGLWRVLDIFSVCFLYYLLFPTIRNTDLHILLGHFQQEAGNQSVMSQLRTFLITLTIALPSMPCYCFVAPFFMELGCIFFRTCICLLTKTFLLTLVPSLRMSAHHWFCIA